MQPKRYIIQIDLPASGSPDLDATVEELKKRGVEVDPGYRPVCINPKLRRYVVRGFADAAACSAAEQLGGVQFFADSPVQGA